MLPVSPTQSLTMYRTPHSALAPVSSQTGVRDADIVQEVISNEPLFWCKALLSCRFLWIPCCLFRGTILGWSVPECEVSEVSCRTPLLKPSYLSGW